MLAVLAWACLNTVYAQLFLYFSLCSEYNETVIPGRTWPRDSFMAKRMLRTFARCLDSVRENARASTCPVNDLGTLLFTCAIASPVTTLSFRFLRFHVNEARSSWFFSDAYFSKSRNFSSFFFFLITIHIYNCQPADQTYSGMSCVINIFDVAWHVRMEKNGNNFPTFRFDARMLTKVQQVHANCISFPLDCHWVFK